MRCTVVMLATLMCGVQAHASETEQARLCSGDVMRLCASSVPSRSKIIACMQLHHDELSPACRHEFDRANGEQQQPSMQAPR